MHLYISTLKYLQYLEPFKKYLDDDFDFLFRTWLLMLLYGGKDLRYQTKIAKDLESQLKRFSRPDHYHA